VPGRAPKSKGDAFERELAAHISETLGITATRAPLSGGGKPVFSTGGGADLIGVPDLHIEAKRVEKLSFPDALRQAEEAIAKSGAPQLPIVVNRRNRQKTGDSYTLMRLDAFLIMYATYLAYTGAITYDSAEQAMHSLRRNQDDK